MAVFIDGKSYSLKEIMDRIRGCERPLVYANACTHGNEKVGSEVIDALEKITLVKGTLLTNIANREAFAKNVRFIEHDLNRVFPGNLQGSYEERLAHDLLPIIKNADVVIDIHSTNSGVDSSVIVENINERTISLIRSMRPRSVLIMNATKGNALISYAKVGIAFEYGKDTDKNTFDNTLRDVLVVLEEMKMVKTSVARNEGATCCYKVIESVEKPEGFVVDNRIRNFRLVKIGDTIASNGKGDIKAKRDFYPILFGENSYKTIFGFMAEKVDWENV